MIWWRCLAQFYKKKLSKFDPRTVQIKAIIGSNWRNPFLAIGAILIDSPYKQGSQQLKNEKLNLWNPGCNLVCNLSVEIDKLKNMSWKRAGRDPGSAVSPYIRANRVREFDPILRHARIWPDLTTNYWEIVKVTRKVTRYFSQNIQTFSLQFK